MAIRPTRCWARASRKTWTICWTNSTARETTPSSGLEVTWSEQLAQYLNMRHAAAARGWRFWPVHRVQDAGLRRFRHLGHRVVGVVFFGQFVGGTVGLRAAAVLPAGRAADRPRDVLFPGDDGARAQSAAALMFGSLVWAMLDLWPGEPISFSRRRAAAAARQRAGRSGPRGGALSADAEVSAERRTVGTHDSGSRRGRRTRSRARALNPPRPTRRAAPR